MTWLQTIFQKLVAHMAELRGADFKIAFYLVSQVVASGSTEISISWRSLSDATGISKSTIAVALDRLEACGFFLREPGGCHRKDRYLLPAFRPLDVGGPLSGPQDQACVPISGPPHQVGGQISGPPGQACVPISGPPHQVGGPISGTGVPISGPPPYKERAGAPVESSSFVGSSSSSIDRVLRTTTLRDDQRADADVLRRHLRAFIVRVADASLDGKDIDDAIVAQCLAIAQVDALCNCLDDLRARRVPPFQTLGWFVTAFAKHFMGVSPAEVKSARGSLRPVRKPVNGETPDPGFNRAVIHELLTSVRGLG